MTGMTSLQLKKGAAAAQKFASLTFLTAITSAVVISTRRLPVTVFGFSSFLPLGLFFYIFLSELGAASTIIGNIGAACISYTSH